MSQSVLLKLVDKGMTREDAYKIVQSNSMNVWENKNKNLKEELINSKEVRKYLSEGEINEIFEKKTMLKNVDFIFLRTIENRN